jgi:uncharacterized sporulation protein YeaH/YhbH (DUF444 family)
LAAGIAAAQIGGDEGGMGGGGGRGGGRGGGGGGGDMGGGMAQVRRLTKTEMLFEKLKLNKEQKEEAATIISAAMEKAAPTRELLNKGRMVIANTITGKGSEDEIKKMLGEYASVSATMTSIEAEAFGKLYALLKPNQQAKAPQAFELMAGMFAGGGMPGGAGRGRGRQ